MSRTKLAEYGPHGRRVTVWAWDSSYGLLVSCEWYIAGNRQRRSWPDTRDNRRLAKAWAQTFAEERVGTRSVEAAPLTLRALWDIYHAHNWPALRPATRVKYEACWRAWEVFAGREFPAERVTRQMIHEYRRALEKRGFGVLHLHDHIQIGKTVYNWAEREELIGLNKFRTYQLRIGKDQKPKSPDEYTGAEADALLKQLDPAKASQWRAWVAMTLLEQHGVRQHAGLELAWPDLDLRRRVIKWPKETDKNGRGLVQPLRKATVRALRVARDWARREGVESRWVIWGPAIPPAKNGGPRAAGERPYTIQSFWKALQGAEKRAGVEHKPQRAGHGFRRKMVGDLAHLTGDTLLALRLVGDRDPRMAEQYRKDRDEQMEATFRQLDRHATRTAGNGEVLSD